VCISFRFENSLNSKCQISMSSVNSLPASIFLSYYFIDDLEREEVQSVHCAVAVRGKKAAKHFFALKKLKNRVLLYPYKQWGK